MCFQRAKWQREVVKEHKFDFVCTEDFKTNDITTRIKYLVLFLIVIKIILVYVADLWTAGILLIFNSWSSAITPAISIDISKWIYVGCIIVSFLLLIWDWKKAKSIIASRDISFAFTSIIAYRFYALRSYSYYCFFREIDNQKKWVDILAFFIFFTFKGWKRLIFAEAPRQVINAVTLYTLIQTNSTRDWMNLNAYGNNVVERLAMGLMAFTLISFILSALNLGFAFILYIPLLFHIRGNLKEYCCHKINKRIDKLVKKESRKRWMNQRIIDQAVAKGDIKMLRKNKGHSRIKSMIARSKRQPTLPTFIDDDDNNSEQSNRQEPPPQPILSPPIYNHVTNMANITSPEPPVYNRMQPHLNMNMHHSTNPRPPRSNSPHEFTYINSGPHPPPPPRSNSPHNFTYINSGPQTNYLNVPLPPTSPTYPRTPSPPGPSHVRYQPPPHNNSPNGGNGGPAIYASQNEMFNNNYYNPYDQNHQMGQMGYGRR